MATRTMSTFINRLEIRFLNEKAMSSMLNFIDFTHSLKRRFVAFIDGRQIYINADLGFDFDLMSSIYVRAHDYKIDRRTKCRKRIQIANGSVVEIIEQVKATLTVTDGSSYFKMFDVFF